MAHTQVAIILAISGLISLILVAFGIIAPFPNQVMLPTCLPLLTFICWGEQNIVNPMNYLVPASFFFFTPIVWYAMGKAEGEIQG